MAPDLRALLRPETTAVVTIECQRGVVGDRGPLPALTDAVRRTGMIERAAAVVRAARAAGAAVLHGVVHRRRDGGGVIESCKLLEIGRATGAPLLAGSEAAALVPELGPEPGDYVVPRLHGVTLFHDTELDSLLRSLGARTVVLLGPSLNVGVPGTAVEAVNRGYRVVVPADGVVGVPEEYGEQVLRHTMRMLATVTTCAAVIEALASATPAEAGARAARERR